MYILIPLGLGWSDLHGGWLASWALHVPLWVAVYFKHLQCNLLNYNKRGSDITYIKTVRTIHSQIHRSTDHFVNPIFSLFVRPTLPLHQCLWAVLCFFWWHTVASVPMFTVCRMKFGHFFPLFNSFARPKT